MSFSSGKKSITIEEVISKVTEADILAYYLGIQRIPCVICSPFREDKNPSFGLYTKDGKRIFYKDFATNQQGGLFDLLSLLWGIEYIEVLERVYNDIPKFNIKTQATSKLRGISTINNHKNSTDLKCKVREWKDYDIEYWKSYGISIEWLKYAEVYPISHKIIIKNNSKYVFKADKYAYVYVEHKEGQVTLKIYQPFNKDGYKWSNKNDGSVVSLWTKIPSEGDIVCICSSVKDALCLWANTGIPSIAVQGEGYTISNTAIKELKKRYKRIFILFDNDKPGIEGSKKLSEHTGFTNVILPQFNEGKDISDLMKFKGKEEFLKVILPLFI